MPITKKEQRATIQRSLSRHQEAYFHLQLTQMLSNVKASHIQHHKSTYFAHLCVHWALTVQVLYACLLSTNTNSTITIHMEVVSMSLKNKNIVLN